MKRDFDHRCGFAFRTLISAIIFLAFNGIIPSAAQSDDAISRIDRQRDLFPQERLYAATDRDLYCAGDTVWLRVFVTDASTLRQTAISKYAYVELRNPFNCVSHRVKLLEREGVYAGYLPLAEDLPEGSYTLVAYTAFAENAGSDYFFRKPLEILAPYSSKYTIDSEFTPSREGEVKGTFRLRPLTGNKMNYNVMSWEMPDGKKLEMPDASKGFSRKFKRADGEHVVLVKFGDYARYIPVEYPVEKTQICFYPEGGWLIAGEPCTVAFKATDANGSGIPVSGTISDDTGNDVTEFTTQLNGMGTFSIVPTEGRTYTARYIGPDGMERVAEVGAPKPHAAALRYGESASRCFFSVAGGKGLDLELVVACRGNGVLAAPLSCDKPVTMNKKSLETGLYQALLVSRSDSAVVSERLFFIGADRKAPDVVRVAPDSMSLKLRAPEGTDVDCCVRIIEKSAGQAGSRQDIRTQLLLQSELRGRIEDPGHYFREGDREARKDLDLLMMVNGWSRYNLPDAILGKYAEPEIPLEIGQEISGQVRSRWRNKPLKGIMVCAISPKTDFGTFADTDSDGIFHINGFDLPEDTPFIFRAMNEKGENEGNYDIFPDKFPDAEALMPAARDDGSDAEISEFLKNSKWIMLDEINVQAFNKEPEDIYSILSSYSKGSEDFERQGITSIEGALRGVSGMVSIGGRLYWRMEPVVYYIDGTIFDPDGTIIDLSVSRFAQVVGKSDSGSSSVPTPATPLFGKKASTPLLSEVESLVPFPVIDRIDFLRPEHSVILGRVLGGGAIVITTKSGDKKILKRQFEIKDYLPLGYQKYKEYASPLLSSEFNANQQHSDDTLLWIPSVKITESGTSIDLTMPIKSEYDITVEGIIDNLPFCNAL